MPRRHLSTDDGGKTLGLTPTFPCDLVRHCRGPVDGGRLLVEVSRGGRLAPFVVWYTFAHRLLYRLIADAYVFDMAVSLDSPLLPRACPSCGCVVVSPDRRVSFCSGGCEAAAAG